MTAAIIMQDGHTHSAASLCAGISYGGYNDWYLPTEVEWQRLAPNRNAIEDAIDASGIPADGFFPDNSIDAYWTADEPNATQAVPFSFTMILGWQPKTSKLSVRAFRSF